MSDRKTRRAPRDQKWSEWSKPDYKHYPVTRGELISLLVHFKQQLHEDRWHRRLLRWLKHGWLPNHAAKIGEERPANKGAA